MIRLKPGVEWRQVNDEIVALHLDTSAYLGVNGSGTQLWPMVAQGTSEAELTDELLARFPIDADGAQADVAAFVEQLRSHELLSDDE